MTEANPDTAKPKGRERKALALFIALVLAGGIAILAYFVTGRGWSVAATIVDENIGNMGDYTVVVFNGIGEKRLVEGEETATLFEAAEDGDTADPDADPAPALIGQAEPAVPPDGRADLSEGLIPLDENGDISYSNLGDRIMSVFYRAMAKFQTEGQSRAYASDVRSLYESAGAEACTLSISDLSRYDTPKTFTLSDRRMGVFSASSYMSRARISQMVDSFRADDVDTVICIAKDASLLATTDGIDIVIANERDEEEDADEEKSDAYIIDPPSKGEVGIILISSNNVPVYKSITEL